MRSDQIRALVMGIAVPFRGWLVPDTRRSDNASFWDAAYPALMVQFVNHPSYPDRRSATAAWRHGHFFGRPVRGS